uniref:Uncharacterized protein n=1 Tax=Medicago truncatula TaxID=3880 RepID=I3SP10_MEDTR|nr:unknown [Medicago truncatula]
MKMSREINLHGPLMPPLKRKDPNLSSGNKNSKNILRPCELFICSIRFLVASVYANDSFEVLCICDMVVLLKLHLL